MGSPPADRTLYQGERFPPASRIRREREIRSLLTEGTKARSPHLDVFTAPAPGHVPRFGTIVPRYGRKVVARNVLRRRLREIGRREVLPRLARTGRSLDLLVRSRPNAYEAHFRELEAELLRLTERLCADASCSG